MNNFRQPYHGRNISERGQYMNKQAECTQTIYAYTQHKESEGITCKSDMTEYPLAMAYVPMQGFTNLYEPYNALEHGTLFKDLDLDFKGGKHNAHNL